MAAPEAVEKQSPPISFASIFFASHHDHSLTHSLSYFLCFNNINGGHPTNQMLLIKLSLAGLFVMLC